MSNYPPSRRLVSRLRAHGVLPRDKPAELRSTGSRSDGSWSWYARNPITGEEYEVGSQYRQTEVLNSVKWDIWVDGKGRTNVDPAA